MKKIRKFKKGAASFYIVAISTLILVIIAASFAAVIISEIARTSNDDLAQSAYDAALAGVEDAKLAYYNYQKCLEDNSCDPTVQALINNANAGKVDCDMVATMLGRTVEEDKGVLVQETDKAGNNMQQYYTCTILRTEVPDYKTMLTSANPTKVMRAKFEGDGVADTIKSIKVSWQRDSDDSTMKYSDFTKEGIFGTDAPLPPVLSVGLIQTGGNSFNLSDFDMTQVENGEQKTDRGTVYLVPTDKSDLEKKDDYYWVVEDKYISKDGFLKSNDKTVKNKPYAVYCDNSEEYACSVIIGLPDPIGGERSDETFMIALSLPYAEASASTNVKLEFCNDEEGCYVQGTEEVDGETKQTTTRVPLKTQISIDSTGRANDLYRRVETRLEPGDTAFPYPLYAIQVLGNDSGSLINKNISPTCEWDFGNATGPRGLCENT